MKTKLILICIAGLLLIAGCEMNKLNNAQDLYNNRRYAAAIQELDDYIPKANNGAIKTRAEMLRSLSYYELATLSIERQNFPLAINFFKLANTEEADEQLAKIYKVLANRAADAKDIPTQLIYLNSVIREIPKSPLVPEMLFRRMAIKLEVAFDRDGAWHDYMKLFDLYPNNSYELQARNIVKGFIAYRIELAQLLSQQEYFTDALAVLFEVARYPVYDFNDLNKQISDTYQAQAEVLIIDQDYIAADHHFRIAVQYYPQKKDVIDRRLKGIASMFIEKGDNLLADRDFDGAMIHYEKTFEIIPNYAPAIDAIRRLGNIRANIQRAALLFIEAEKLESANKLSDALTYYREALRLDAKPEYNAKVNQMQNLIEAAKNPSAFALKTITEFRGGILTRRINELKANLAKNYKAEEIRDSGWKIMLSTGQNKYEARYDILTPGETYFYIWQINLRDKSIVPLNKLSESLMQ